METKAFKSQTNQNINSIQNIIYDFIDKILEKYNNKIDKIILYGSYARGEATKNSDIDIMILVNEEDERSFKEIRIDILSISYDIEDKYNFLFDLSPIVKKLSFYNEWENTLPLFINVKKEGVVLYTNE